MLIRFIKSFFARIHRRPRGIYYVNGPDVLPAPLSREEENEALLRLPEDESARAALIEHNLRLVVYIARKFENTGVLMDDLISVGTIGLIKAVQSFNLEKNIKLATYASRCIENEILMFLRKTVKYKSEVSFDEPLNTDLDGNELLLSDVMGTEVDVVYKKIETDVEEELLISALKHLNKREREIVELRFGLLGQEE